MSTDMIRFVEVNGWQVAVAGVGDAEEKIRDVDLAEKLGYTRPRDIRKLIERLMKEGKLADVCCRAVVAQQSTGHGGTRSFPVNEYWLNEPQALKVIAKAHTQLADQILDQVIAVFVYVRKNRVALAPVQTSAISELQAKASLLREMRPYYEDCISQLEELEAASVITKETKLAHRTKLLKDVAGIDLTVAPAMQFQNTTLVQASSVKVDETKKVPGELPVANVDVRPQADLTGFRTCASIASELGVKPDLISKIGRAMGWHSKEGNTAIGEDKNHYGVFVPVLANGHEVNDHWQYNDRLVPEFRTISMQVLEAKKNLPKKTGLGRVVESVVKQWKDRPAEAPQPELSN